MEERMRNALLERAKLTQKQLNELDMRCVLEGKDIPIRYKGEFENHYTESNWTAYSEYEQSEIRLWIRDNLTPIEPINLKHTSYSLKQHFLEDVGFYVHNDTMKKALLLEGYKAQTGRENWYFNISEEYWTKREKEKEREERELCHISLKLKNYR